MKTANDKINCATRLIFAIAGVRAWWFRVIGNWVFALLGNLSRGISVIHPPKLTVALANGPSDFDSFIACGPDV
jgi:hypothetical protein